MAADTVLFTVGAHDHGHGIPARERTDAAFQFHVARVGGLFRGRDGVYIRRVRGKGNLDALGLGED